MKAEASPEESRSDIAEMRTQHQHLYGSATASNRCRHDRTSGNAQQEEEEVDDEEARQQVRNREWCRVVSGGLRWGHGNRMPLYLFEDVNGWDLVP
ncbi:hypothetical protein LX32DRAFT_726733 [Colletotrichum zoysiae]|uniref:Uncharacterized protein n=1 Tax=Colletotrichum zoysiae TaxID=1216348 RepID=A0AAD9HL61_9PEZI|nr:hypothetical protein LX32DRAFT_726733 [Colletotrichum zoysiae]